MNEKRRSERGSRLIRRGVSPVILFAMLGPAAASAQTKDWILPSSAFRAGANGAEFRTDVRLLNPGRGAVSVAPTFYDQSTGETISAPTFRIAARAQASFDNVLSSLFGRTLGSYGPIRFQTVGALNVSASVNNVNACGGGATSGQWLPGLDASSALRTGTIGHLAVSANQATGYRTNIVFANPLSRSATVRVRVRVGGGPLLSSTTIGPLGANGFRQVALSDPTVFPGIAGITDTDLWLEFTSDGPVLAFASIINNGSGDPFAVLATGDAPETSYANFKSVGLAPENLPPEVAGQTARAWADFSGTGRLDLFTATLTYSLTKPIGEATSSRFEFWRRQDDGSYVKDSTLLLPGDTCIHPRKAIVADFNGDGRPDVFVACHGYDAAPFPGEQNRIVLSQPDGHYVVRTPSTDIGFFHGAAAADLDGDGIPDVIAVNNLDPRSAIVLLNRGDGTFIREAPNRLPASIGYRPYFSVELVDVNGDGAPDVVLGGHDWENAPTVVLLNPGNNDFSAVSPVTLPAVTGEGVVLDFVVTGPTTARVVWVLRTSGGDGTFYQSRTIQRVSWPSLDSAVVLSQRPAAWIPWIIPAFANGRNVIASDDSHTGVSVPQ